MTKNEFEVRRLKRESDGYSEVLKKRPLKVVYTALFFSVFMTLFMTLFEYSDGTFAWAGVGRKLIIYFFAGVLLSLVMMTQAKYQRKRNKNKIAELEDALKTEELIG